ncbi:peptidoglycan-binding protein [Nonomuraea turkmeniaca]|uniref:Peptidoglycan-binding protein n=1 Tax=Nonomuraea turkmeniaca TaxID=103838 RepID=A0A5S4FIQ7_9ACTN|nr:peptidoglycan-binding protein [Nonomuraea turkmeniaca]TMR20495.1 peptidoglycan-binding protein [Nonomuraea turkmeniaca]
MMLDSEIEAPVGRESSDTPAGTPRRRRRRGRVLLGATAVLAVAVAGGVYVLQNGQSKPPPAPPALPTAPVIRTDMVNVRNMDGTLGYDGSYTVLAGGSGRITWVPDAGDVITRGERVYEVNGHRVPLFYGSAPLWRDLRQGVTKGRDVLELERNLKALGYAKGLDMTVDRTFTWTTARAIRKWQADMNVTRTGVMKMDDVVMQSGAIRVTDVKAVPGANAGGTVLTASGTERIVTVALPVSEQTIARKGGKVRIVLPGGKTATGRVSSVGKVATAGTTTAQSQTGQGTETATIPVYISLDKKRSAGGLDTAPVTVGFAGTAHKDVLAVPVNALLAAADGSYSVNVVNAAGAVSSVPVKLGIFDGDNVEVTGDLTEGMKVQVPRS